MASYDRISKHSAEKDVEGRGHGLSWSTNLLICLEELRKNMKNLARHSQCHSYMQGDGYKGKTNNMWL